MRRRRFLDIQRKRRCACHKRELKFHVIAVSVLPPQSIACLTLQPGSTVNEISSRSCRVLLLTTRWSCKRHTPVLLVGTEHCTALSSGARERYGKSDTLCDRGRCRRLPFCVCRSRLIPLHRIVALVVRRRRRLEPRHQPSSC